MRYIGAAGVMLAIAVMTAISPAATGRAYDLYSSPWRDPVAVADLRIDATDLRDTNQLPRSLWLAALHGAVEVWNGAAAAEHLPLQMRVVLDDPEAEIYILLTDSDLVQLRRPDGELVLPTPSLLPCDSECLGATGHYTCDFFGCVTKEGGPVDRAVIKVPATRPWVVLDGPTSEPSDSIDAQTMFMHELGHALGLNHSPKSWLNQDCSSLMVGVEGDPCTAEQGKAGRGAFVRRELARDDVCGLRHLYGNLCVGALRGVVIDGRGSAVSDANVVLEAANGGTTTIHTDRQGYYHFEGIPIGPAKLAVLKNGLSTGVSATVGDLVNTLLPDIVLGPVPPAPEGAFIKADGPDIYVYSDGTRRAIPDWDTFLARGGASDLTRLWTTNWPRQPKGLPV